MPNSIYTGTLFGPNFLIDRKVVQNPFKEKFLQTIFIFLADNFFPPMNKKKMMSTMSTTTKKLAGIVLEKKWRIVFTFKPITALEKKEILHFTNFILRIAFCLPIYFNNKKLV